MNQYLTEAAQTIKDAIVRSRYQAVTLVNKELLALYYGVGKYVSINSRSGYWGKGAIKNVSDTLQKELPGLRGFSEVSIKRMRLFFETWNAVFSNSPLVMDDIIDDDEDGSLSIYEKQTLPLAEDTIDLSLLARQTNDFSLPGFSAAVFMKVGFTHHSEILAKEKSLEGRLFYLSKCASEFWTVEALKSSLRGELFAKNGTMPNNFTRAMPDREQAYRAIRAFKDEYLLDFINVEDEIDPEERLIGDKIVSNIKKFIMSFGGSKFCFMGNEYRIVYEEKEWFIDLLFFHRELHCLIAIELKRGEFNPAHLGQLYFYLAALDEFVRQPDEEPSIGILLCKEANRNIVEFAVRDYSKPMGVATYKTLNEMPIQIQNALPDVEDIMNAMDNVFDDNDEDES